jgi:ABC-type transport system involved in cytochrome c biogenesis permease component
VTFSALLWKDTQRELRGKEALQAGLVIVGLFLVLDILAFPDLAGEFTATASVLWAPLLYATAALVGRGFASEYDRHTIQLLRSSPVPAAWHGWSRTIVHGVLVFVLAAATVLLVDALFAIRVTPALWLTVALAAVGLTTVGTLASGLAAQARAREALLPILLIPVVVPLLHAGISATVGALAGGSAADLRPALLLMVGYDVAALGIAWLLWPVVLEVD